MMSHTQPWCVLLRQLLVLSILLLVITPRKSFGKFTRRHRLPETDFAEDERHVTSREPQLLFTKTFRNAFFSLGSDVEVDYQIFNVGNVLAKDILVTDPDFISGNGKFQVAAPKQQENGIDKKMVDSVVVTSGQFQLANLFPGENRSFTLTATTLLDGFPENGGQHTFQYAMIRYTLLIENEALEKVGWSSLNHSKVEFLSKIKADRIHGSKMADFLAFLMLISVPVLLPFFMWTRHTSKYNTLQQELKLIKTERKAISKKAKRSKMANKRSRI